MAKYLSTKIANKQSVVIGDQKNELVNERISVALDASLALNDMVLFGKLPSSHDLIDSIVLSDALDSSTGLRVTVGILNDAADGIVAGTEIITTTAVGNSGAASFTRPTLVTSVIPALTPAQLVTALTSDLGCKNTYVASKFPNSSSTNNVFNGDRVLAAKITTAATGTKADGNLTLSYTYKAI